MIGRLADCVITDLLLTELSFGASTMSTGFVIVLFAETGTNKRAPPLSNKGALALGVWE